MVADTKQDRIFFLFHKIITESTLVTQAALTQFVLDAKSPLNLRIVTTFALAGFMACNYPHDAAEKLVGLCDWLTEASDDDIRALYVKD